MTQPDREELAGRLEEIIAEHLRLASWNRGKDRPARVAFHHDAASTLKQAAAALRQSPSVEELETLAVTRLIEFANDVEGNTRSRRAVLACERAKSLAQAIDRLYRGSKE